MNNELMKLSALGIPVWALVIFGAWLASNDLGAAATMGYVIQWAVNAPAKFPRWAGPVAVLAIGGTIYVFALGHPLPIHQPEAVIRAWAAAFALWLLAAQGTGSSAGKTGGAPASDSIGAKPDPLPDPVTVP